MNRVWKCAEIVVAMAFIVAALPTFAHGEEQRLAGEPPQLKGLYLGMSEQALIEKMPEFKCHATERWSGNQKYFDRTCDADKSTIAGQPASAVGLFLSGKLESVTFHLVASGSFPIVAESLIEKFGKPDQDQNELFVTNGGESAKNRWLHWRLKEAHLVAREHFYALNSPGIRLTTPYGAMFEGRFLAPPPKSNPKSDL